MSSDDAFPWLYVVIAAAACCCCIIIIVVIVLVTRKKDDSFRQDSLNYADEASFFDEDEPASVETGRTDVYGVAPTLDLDDDDVPMDVIYESAADMDRHL